MFRRGRSLRAGFCGGWRRRDRGGLHRRRRYTLVGDIFNRFFRRIGQTVLRHHFGIGAPGQWIAVGGIDIHQTVRRRILRLRIAFNFLAQRFVAPAFMCRHLVGGVGGGEIGRFRRVDAARRGSTLNHSAHAARQKGSGQKREGERWNFFHNFMLPDVQNSARNAKVRRVKKGLKHRSCLIPQLLAGCPIAVSFASAARIVQCFCKT